MFGGLLNGILHVFLIETYVFLVKQLIFKNKARAVKKYSADLVHRMEPGSGFFHNSQVNIYSLYGFTVGELGHGTFCTLPLLWYIF